MRPSLYIGLRFTTSRKRSLIFNLLGVIFGVAFFVCTQAQTQGFEQYFIKTILGTSGAIVISDRFQNRYTTFDNAEGSTVLSGQQRRKYYEGITDAAEIMRVARQFSNVTACAPIVQGNVTARGDFQTRGGDPAGHRPRPAPARHRAAHADHRAAASTTTASSPTG